MTRGLRGNWLKGLGGYVKGYSYCFYDYGLWLDYVLDGEGLEGVLDLVLRVFGLGLRKFSLEGLVEGC